MRTGIDTKVGFVVSTQIYILRRTTVGLIILVALVSTSPVFWGQSLSGSQVTVMGECCTLGTPITVATTQTVPASFPAGSIVPLPGSALLPMNIQVGAKSISFQILSSLSVGPSSFDGYVFHFTGAPTITGASLDPASNLPLPVVLGFKPDEITVNFNPAGQTFTPSSIVVVNVSLAAPQPVPRILPQLAFGGGWYTTLYFTNTTTAPVSFKVSFTGNDGSALTLAAFGSSSVTVNLAARGAALIEAPNVGSLVQGYVTAVLPTGVTGYGVFRASGPGVPDQEAVVPLSGNTATTSTLLFDDTKYITGVAVVNLASVSNTITATAHDNQGNTIGTGTIPLGPNAKTALVLRNIPGLASVAGAIGSVDFMASIGNVAALGLRFNGTAFTSIPTSDR